MPKVRHFKYLKPYQSFKRSTFQFSENQQFEEANSERKLLGSSPVEISNYKREFSKLGLLGSSQVHIRLGILCLEGFGSQNARNLPTSTENDPKSRSENVTGSRELPEVFFLEKGAHLTLEN